MQRVSARWLYIVILTLRISYFCEKKYSPNIAPHMSFAANQYLKSSLPTLKPALYVHMLAACKQTTTTAKAATMAALTAKVTVNVTVTWAMAAQQ